MEKAKCECTYDKEPCDLKCILKQQLGKYSECNWPGNADIIGAKHLQWINVISIKATVLEFVFQESQTKVFFVCVASGSQGETKEEIVQWGKQKYGGVKVFSKKY